MSLRQAEREGVVEQGAETGWQGQSPPHSEKAHFREGALSSSGRWPGAGAHVNSGR